MVYLRNNFIPLMIVVLLLSIGHGSPVAAQQPQTGKTAKLSLPGEVDLATLVDYVSQRLEIRILYDNKLSTKKINIRAPKEVPIDTLRQVLQSALRMNGLALIDTSVPGWMQIVEIGQFPMSATHEDAQIAADTLGGETPVTQVFLLEHADPTQLEQSIRPFLSQPTGTSSNVLAIKDQRMLVVTDFASNILRLEKLIKLIDQPRESVVTRFIPAQELDAQKLSEKVNQLLSARQKASGKGQQEAAGVEVTFDERTNQLIIIGDMTQVKMVEEYLKTLDVSVNLRTEVYTLKRMSPNRLDQLVSELLEVRESRPPYRSITNLENNVLIATTTEDLHLEIAALIERMDGDMSLQERSNPVRFYKLKHATADELLQTIHELEGSATKSKQGNSRDQRSGAGRIGLQPQTEPNGIMRPDTQLPPDVRERSGQLPEDVVNAAAAATQLASQIQVPQNANTAAQTPANQLTLSDAVGRAKITADVPANTLIIIATPEVHAVYEDLIRQLDQARPQVLIEAKLVVIDTSDDFTLGVEVSGGDRSGDKKLFAFSSYGFSQVNANNGALSILPGVGFNGTLVNPQVADVVLRAVTKHRRSKVLSSPRILVNDHATGFLTSVTEVPFNSLNTFNNVSSTSFAGYAEAGTTVTVTPHISEGDHLKLEYTVTLNAFQASAGTSGGPPPRQTDELESAVTIPDGHTIIVGGLTRSNNAVTIDSIPYIENIPLLRHLLSKTDSQSSGSSLFVFLRPVILRDDKFRDLKYLSERDTKAANIPGTFPRSEPILLR